MKVDANRNPRLRAPSSMFHWDGSFPLLVVGGKLNHACVYPVLFRSSIAHFTPSSELISTVTSASFSSQPTRPTPCMYLDKFFIQVITRSVLNQSTDRPTISSSSRVTCHTFHSSSCKPGIPLDTTRYLDPHPRLRCLSSTLSYLLLMTTTTTTTTPFAEFSVHAPLRL